MTIGVGQGKTEAMFVSATTVKQACADDVNGMMKRSVAVNVSTDFDPAASDDSEDPDDDHATVFDDEDEEWLPGDDPVVEAPRPKRGKPKLLPIRSGQALVDGKLRGVGTGKPLPYVPRRLPPLPTLPTLCITVPVHGENPKVVAIPWTSLYKYLGFMLRADLLDDHAYQRVEKKTKAATTLPPPSSGTCLAARAQATTAPDNCVEHHCQCHAITDINTVRFRK